MATKRNLKNNSRLLNSITNNATDSKQESRKRLEKGKALLQELDDCVQNCQSRFGGKAELATEDDIRIVNLCEKWEKVLSHGIRTNLSNSAIQSLVSAGLHLTFNIVNTGNSLWSYTCLHLTKHEKERFKILSNINTPLGYFRAFLRATLNERSLERYLQSWLGHGLLMEYYDEGALVRDLESANSLINMAAGLSTILFALSIDRAQLNETQTNINNKVELVIPLTAPMNTAGNLKKKPLRQVISFDITEDGTNANQHKDKRKSLTENEHDSWNSAPATCVNSPDPATPPKASGSEPTSSDYKSSIRQFFPESVKAMDSPSQMLSKLSECAKEIFSYPNNIDRQPATDSASERSFSNLRIYESDDSAEVAGSINGSTSCLELCLTEDESIPEDSKNMRCLLDNKEKEIMNLQLKCSKIEIATKEKISKLERIILDLSKENDRIKEQLRHYMSAVEMGIALKTGNGDSNQETQYERKLVQVAEMHAELMEFNQHLQKRLQEMENKCPLEVLNIPESNVKVHIPSAFLVGKKTNSYHVYQIFLKVGLEEWNVYHRYAKFHELHIQLKKCHPDIASYKFPPKKTLRKRDAHLVEQRRVALLAYLRHVLLVLPELRQCTSRAQLMALLPFFGTSSTTSQDKGFSQIVGRQPSIDSISTYEAM